MGLCLTLLAGCGKAETKEAAAPTPEPTVTKAPTVTPTETPTPEPTAEATPEPTEEPLAADTLAEGMVYSYLTGQPIEEAKGRRRPAAVMLNNIITACPQTGISRAGVIYEAPVEGGITRLMGIFEDYDDLEKIGSVRSCREYYVFLDTGFDAVYYHYGQAHYAVPYLESDNIDNVNGMNGYSDVYYRTSDRKPPHNAYTSGEGIKRGMEIIGCRTSYREDYEGFFQFAKESEPVILENGTTANKVTPGGYQHNKPWFEYDASTGTYLRYQFGEPQIDDMNNEQLAAKNILIQFCSWSKYSDDESYLNIDVQSGGTGKYITNGKAIDVTWSKNDEWGITYFYDTNGNRITMNPGKTWILLVQDNFIDSTVIE